MVGTPIGNLEDMTLRAIRILKEVDVIACEDTRRTQTLLNHYLIRTRTTSYHEHNEMTKAPELIIELEEGSNIALVSDAGMPVISDPGFRLIKLAIRHGIRVIPVPGASAFVAALAAAGLPVNKFFFSGFLPAKAAARQKVLEEIKNQAFTHVFYEAPHRIRETLAQMEEILGPRPVVVAREVTKAYEEFLRGTPSEVLSQLQKNVKGEITLLVGPPAPESQGTPVTRRSISEEIETLMAGNALDERAALKAVARARGISKSEAYRLWQREKGKRES